MLEKRWASHSWTGSLPQSISLPPRAKGHAGSRFVRASIMTLIGSFPPIKPLPRRLMACFSHRVETHGERNAGSVLSSFFIPSNKHEHIGSHKGRRFPAEAIPESFFCPWRRQRLLVISVMPVCGRTSTLGCLISSTDDDFSKGK
jgi:hypothetical protein